MLRRRQFGSIIKRHGTRGKAKVFSGKRCRKAENETSLLEGEPPSGHAFEASLNPREQIGLPKGRRAPDSRPVSVRISGKQKDIEGSPLPPKGFFSSNISVSPPNVADGLLGA